jgi:hypothetical protein
MSVDKAERERIIAKIKKCLALGKSSEPHEAASAIRQAQKLMEKFGIEADDVEGDLINNELVITPEPPKRKYPLYMVGIFQTVARAFGVQALFCTVTVPKRGPEATWNVDYRLGVRYFGTGNAPMMAKYTHEVMWNAMMKSWRSHQRTMMREAMPGERQSFWLGWIAAVDQTIQNFAKPPNHDERVRRSMQQYHGGELKSGEANKMKLDSEASRAMLRKGHAAGSDFSIHRPVGGQTQKALDYDAPALGVDD